MRRGLLAAVLVLGSAHAAMAQPAQRFNVGPVVRTDRVTIEGAATGTTPVAGVVGTLWLSKNFGVEGEVTNAWNRIERSYEGWFISYAEPGASREEVERLAPTARRTLGYTPGTGGSIAFVAATDSSHRVSIAVRAGVSGRSYEQTSSYTVLTIPPGIDPARVARDLADSTYTQTRTGVLFGANVPVRVTDRIRLVPEIRAVFGGIGDYRHREVGLGLRGVWGF